MTGRYRSADVVDALGGTSQALLLCCIAPGDKILRETINTLKFDYLRRFRNLLIKNPDLQIELARSRIS